MNIVLILKFIHEIARILKSEQEFCSNIGIRTPIFYEY